MITFLTGVLGLFLGAAAGVLIGGHSRHSEAVLLSFSAGTMIALVCFELLHEAMETGISPFLIALSAGTGALLVTLLDYAVDKRSGHSQDFITCEGCDEEFEHDAHHAHCMEHETPACGQKAAERREHGHDTHGQETPSGHIHIHAHHAQEAAVDAHVHEHHHKRASHLQLFMAGLIMAAAVAIHNIPEGMSIGAVYAGEGGVVSTALLMLLLSIVMHNIPEGMAISMPLVTGGMQKGKACAIAALSGVPTILGALLGYALGDMGALGLAMSLAFAAGTLLYVVFGEVLPQAINLYCSRKTAFAAIAGLLIGMLILSGHMHVH